MLLDRLRAYLTRDELARIVAEARSPHRRIDLNNLGAAGPLCLALERAAIDQKVPRSPEKVPRRILQFWDQEAIPEDVRNCMATWRAIPGFEHVVFHEEPARDFIRSEYHLRHLQAFDLCNHPAMKSDLFRLAYLYRHGGVYIDVDDAYAGSGMERLFRDDGLLKLRTASFKKDSSMNPVTIYNNNPIFCAPKDEVIGRALERATQIMLTLGKRETYNILIITGPVNISLALYTAAIDCIARNTDLRFSPIIGWDDIARKNTDLEYQRTSRNWRVTG
ncbi:MAG TPA: glycosyltransferase [Rhizomicrobium sp.]|nr:glycosyltransferase [Rhizomicrobium sp.]